jgi:hypothetical protein
MMDSIRQELKLTTKYDSATGMMEPVDEAVVSSVYNVRIVTDFLAKKRIALLKLIFRQGFVKLRQMARSCVEVSRHHWLSKRAGLCFISWSSYVSMTRAGINKRVFDGPRTFEVP